MSNRIAIIGCGPLGAAMHAALDREGHRMETYDVCAIGTQPTAEAAVAEASTVFLCVPAAGLARADWHLFGGKSVVLMSKGMLPDGRLVTELARERMGEGGWCFFGGPMLAHDVRQGHWRACVAGPAADRVTALFASGHARNGGTECDNADRLAALGVAKNVYAMLAGFIKASFGQSMAGALFGQALAREIAPAPIHAAYAADLAACLSPESRNFRRGMELATAMITEAMPEGQASARAFFEKRGDENDCLLGGAVAVAESGPQALDAVRAIIRDGHL